MSNPNTISFSFRKSLQDMAEYASLKSTYDLVIARVTFVLLDDSNKEKFDKLGGWKALGSVECIPFINFNDPTSDPIIARPLNSNISRYPVENELITIRTLVSKEAQNNLGNYKPEIYYTDIISVFNTPEENAAPDSSFFRLNPNAKSITGNYVSSGDNKRLIKAPGDLTVEGRRGSSIRFGSNATNFRTPWQSSKPSPILILSNNPAKVSGSIARFEDVNNDGSVLVMMSGHNINFQAASNNFQSYDTKVVIPEQKNNIVVVDQTPKAKPEESLKQEDEKPIPKETPQPEQKPVATPEPVKEESIKQEDEEQLPEREDLMEIDVQLEFINVTNNEQLDVPDISSTFTNLLQNKSINNKNLGSKYYYPCSVYNQGDPIWAKNTSGKLTMKKYGCCYTSFSMLATNKKNSSLYSPQWFWQNSSKEVMVFWKVMSKSVGLSGVLQNTRSISTVNSVLTKGPLMFEWVSSLSKGTKYNSYYTKGKQHWMVISGINVDGTYTVLDPSGGKILTNQPKEAIEAGLNRIYYFK